MNQRPEVFLIEFLGGLRPNTEVIGYREQVMPRYADPADGVLVSPYSPLAQSFEIRQIPKEVPSQQVREINTRVIPNYDEKRERLRRALLAPLL